MKGGKNEWIIGLIQKMTAQKKNGNQWKLTPVELLN